MADEQSARRAPRAASCPSRTRLPDSSGFSPGARQHADAAPPRDFPHGSKHRSGGRSGRVVKGLARSLAYAANAAASASPASGRDRTARRAPWLQTVIGAFLLAAVAVPAHAQSFPSKRELHQLASNLGQTSASTGNALKDYAYAQAFTTGSQQFLLGSISVDFDAAETGTRQVNAYLYSATSSGRPGNSLAMLTLGVAPTAGVNKFEPTGEYRHSRMAQRILAPNTTYFVVVEAWSTTSTASVALTDSNSEDTGGVSGSSIADGGYRQATGSSTWTASGSAMKIEVNGERYLWVSDEVAREGVNSTLNFKVRVSPPLASGSSLKLRYVTMLAGSVDAQASSGDGVDGALGEDDQGGLVSVAVEPEAAARLARAGGHALEAPCAGQWRGAEDLCTGRVPAGVSADEDGVEPVIGVEEAAAVAGFEHIGAEGALTGEGVADPEPCAGTGPWQVQAARGGLEGGDLLPPLMSCEEVEGVPEAAPRRMDDEVDGAAPSRAAQVVEELPAVDADDRALAPEARPVGGVSAIAEGGGDPVEWDVAAGGQGIAAAHCQVRVKICLEERGAGSVTRYRYPPSLGVRGGNGFR